MGQPDSRAMGTVLQNCSLLGQEGGTAQGSSENLIPWYTITFKIYLSCPFPNDLFSRLFITQKLKNE